MYFIRVMVQLYIFIPRKRSFGCEVGDLADLQL